MSAPTQPRSREEAGTEDRTFSVSVNEGGLFLGRLRKIVSAVAPIIALAYVMAMIGAGTSRPGTAAFIALLTLLGAAPIYAALRRRVRTTLRISKDAVRVADHLPISRDNIARAHIRHGKQSVVELVGRNGAVLAEARVDSELEASDLIAALELPESASGSFELASPMGGDPLRRFATWLGAIAIILGGGDRFGYALAAVALPLALLATTWTATAIVDEKGIVTTWLGKQRFVPASEIRDVRTKGRATVRVLLASGQTLSLRTRGDRFGSAEQARDRLCTSIRNVALKRNREGRSDVIALIARGQRSPEQWLEDLRALRGEGYRQAAIPQEALFEVMEDPAAPEDARGGAAILLRGSLDENGRRRVRVAAEETLSSRLRIALESAATSTDENAAAEEAFLTLGEGEDSIDADRRRAKG